MKIAIIFAFCLVAFASKATAVGGMGIMPDIGSSQLSEYARTRNHEAHTGANAKRKPSSTEQAQSSGRKNYAQHENQDQHPHYTDEQIIQGYDTAVRKTIYQAYDLSDVQVPTGKEKAWIHVEMLLHMDMFARFITSAELSASLRDTVDRQVTKMFHANLPLDTPQRDIDQIYAEAFVQVQHTVDRLWASQQQR